MKLILKDRVEHLGSIGDVVDVKVGYARNYLLPQGLAYEASAANMRRLEEERERAEEKAKHDYLEARRRASQLDGTSISFTARVGEEGKLFGSVTHMDIADRLNELELDFAVERRQVMLQDPYKTTGVFPLTVHLHADVDVEIEVRIDPEED